MERKMKAKTAKTKPPRPFRNFPDAIDEILHGYGPRARVVQIWRQLDAKRDVWTYLGRLPPEQCEVEMIADRFGGGWYRAKILGPWDPSAAERNTSSRSRLESTSNGGR